MIGLIIGGILDGIIDHAVTFLMAAKRERAYFDRRTPGRTVYAPPIVRTFEPWPGAGETKCAPAHQPWPYRPWPGGDGR